MLTTIAKEGESTATTLAARLPVSRPAVLKHLNVLDEVGLVTKRKLGREVRYSVRPQKLSRTANSLARLASEWDSRLEALKQAAEAE